VIVFTGTPKFFVGRRPVVPVGCGCKTSQNTYYKYKCKIMVNDKEEMWRNSVKIDIGEEEKQ